MDITLFIAIATFVVVMLIALLIYFYARYAADRRSLMKRINPKGHESALGVTTDASPVILQRTGHPKQFFAKIASVLGNIAKPKNKENLTRIQTSLLNAGYRSRNAVKIYLGIKVICAILLPAILFFFLHFSPTHVAPLHLMLFYISLALAGFYLPAIWLRLKIAGRKTKILEGFPDALDMLVVCVGAGMGMDAALGRVGEEMKLENDALSEEFKLYNREMRVGIARREALKNLALRTGLEDVSSLVTLLIQTDRFGTSIAQALQTHSDFMRTQRMQRAEEKAAKMTVKLVLPLVFCIFPSVFIVILGPAIINAFRLNSG